MRKACLLLGVLALQACSDDQQQKPTSQSGSSYADPIAKATGGSARTPEQTSSNSVRGNGPFGLALDAKLSDLDVDEASSTPANGFYSLSAVPRPDPAFTTYAVVAFEDAGVCEIRAVSPVFDGDSLGSTVRAEMDRLASSLTSKYGKPEKHDYCGGGEVSCQSEFWAMSVMNGERGYGYEWKGKAPIRSVSLNVSSNQFAEPGMRLDYEMGDAAVCEKAENSSRSGNL